MASRKEKKPSSAMAVPARVTRSSTTAKRVAPPLADPVEEVVVKKRKTVGKKVKAAAPSNNGEGKGGDVKEKEVKPYGEDVDASTRTIVIEACKQCNSFKTRAMMVKEGLESAFSGITVNVNPDRPRRGYFEIRDSCGKVFLSLPSMVRPFKPMKELNMEEVVKQIIEKICS